MSQKKLVWNSESIDWAYWANLQSISAKDACWLVCGVDPIICINQSKKGKYYLSDEKINEIKKAITQVKSDTRAGKEKEFNSPWNWVCWAESRGIPVPKNFHELAYQANLKTILTIKAQPLEKINEQLLTWYFNQDSWTYYEAIYLFYGFKPPGEIEGFDQLRSHFPNEYLILQKGIEIHAIGKEVNRGGQKTFIDTPERWMEWGKSKGIFRESLTNHGAINDNQKFLKVDEATEKVLDAFQSKQSKTQDGVWQEMAKIKADLIYKKLTKIGSDPSKKAIANLIAKEFENEGVKTVKGKRLNDEYIVRHALSAWNRPEK